MTRSILRITIGVVGVIVAWFFVIPYLMLIVSPFSWSEADMDKNGLVSPSEAGYFADFGERQYTEGGNHCTEYYALKDGQALKKECSSE